MSWLMRKSSKKEGEVEEGRRRQPAGRNRTPASTRSVSSSGQTFDNSSDADFLDHDPHHEDNYDEKPQQQSQPKRAHFTSISTSPRGNNNSRQEANSFRRNDLHRSGSTSPRNLHSNSLHTTSPRNMNNAAGNMNYSPNGQPQTRYSMSGGAPSNIFAPVVNSSSGATVASGGMNPRNSMGFSQQPSGGLPMVDYGGSPYGPTSPMPSSSGSVVLTPPMPRPMSMNLGSMSSGGSAAPMMNGMGMNSMSMNNMRLNNNMSMNNMTVGINGVNTMGINNMSISNMNNPMTSIMPAQGLVGPAAGLSPMMVSPAALSPMGQVGMIPSVSGLNMVSGVTMPQYAAAATSSNPVYSPLVAGVSPYAAPAVSQLQTGQLQYLSPIGRTTSVTSTVTDPALELALRQSIIESAPRWVADRSYQVAREEALKKENDDMLERAIRQSLDETNLHRLRQDEIERSNRILQQSNERALEEAIRASLHDYSAQDVQRNRSLDAIEQANEDALQQAIIQSIRESSGTGTSSTLTTSAKYTTATNQGQRTVTITRTNKVPANALVSDFKSGVNSPNNTNINNQSTRGNINGKDRNSSLQQPYQPGPFPPEPPPEVPYYQLQYQQTLQQRQHNLPPVSIEEFGPQQQIQQYYNPDDCEESNDNNKEYLQYLHSQRMTGMKTRHSYGDPEQPQPAAQQSRVVYQQRQPFSDQPQAGDEKQDDDDEFMQPASYNNTPQQPLRQQPSSQFISVGGGQMRGVLGNGSGHMHTGNDGETVVSSSSSGAGIGRNTAAQVTSLYMNNPDLIEQEMQQRYQRQYQLYLQNQLANADMANQRLASSSQDAYDQIQQHHGPQSAGRVPQPLPQQQHSVVKAIFEPVVDAPPSSSQSYPYQQQQQSPPNGANYPAPFRHQTSGMSSTSGKFNQQQLPQQQYNDDQEDNSSRNTSGNLSGNGASAGVSGARRLSQVQSFMGNPLMQSRHSAVAQQQQHIHSSSSTSETNSPMKTTANGAAVSMQSPNKAAFMEKLKRKSGSYNNTNNDTNHSDATTEYNSIVNLNVSVDNDKLMTLSDSNSYAPEVSSSFHSPKHVHHSHQPDGSGVSAPDLPSTKSVGSTASQPTNLTNSQKSKTKSFSAPRASFHQFVSDVGCDTENNNAPVEANLHYHPHGGHHALGIHHEAPHRMSVTEDEYGIPVTVDEKHHPHLHHLKATLSQTQMSLSSDSDEDEDFFRPKTNTNNNSSTNNINNNSSNVVSSFPTVMSTNHTGKTMKKTFSAPKMVDLENDPMAVSATLISGPSAVRSRPGMYDRSAMESVDLDPSKIKIQRKIIHSAQKPV